MSDLPRILDVVHLPDHKVNYDDVLYELMLQALEKHDWVQKDAAEHLSMHPRVFNYKLLRYGIRHQVSKKREECRKQQAKDRAEEAEQSTVITI